MTASKWLPGFLQGQQQQQVKDCDSDDEKVQGPAPPREVDLFDDGGAKLRVMSEADTQKHFWIPENQTEVVIDYKLTLLDGTIVDDRSDFLYTVGSGTAEADGLLVGEVAARCTIDAALCRMHKTEIVQVTCSPVYAFGSTGNTALGIPSNAEVIMELELKALRKTVDIGKEAGWGEGLVRKVELKEGTGHLRPNSEDQECTLRLKKVTTGRNSALMELLGEETLELRTRCGDVCDALECAVGSMKQGEVADIIVAVPDLWALGKPQGLPPKGPIRFHIELVKFSEEKPYATSLQEAFDQAAAMKAAATDLFKCQRIRLAKDRYLRVLEKLPPPEHIKLRMKEEDFGKSVQELRTVSELNLAACALKEQDFSSTISHCSSVLEHESSNIKALFRRAQAFMALEDYEMAREDCKKALDFDHSNREVRELLRKITQKIKSEEGKEKQKHKDFFKGVMKSMGTLGGPERTEEYNTKKRKEWAERELAKAKRDGLLDDSSDDEANFNPEGDKEEDPRKFLEDEAHEINATMIPPKEVAELDAVPEEQQID